MLQIVALLLVSPAGVSVIRDVVYAALIVSDCEECGFNDLGKLLFAGLAAAILIGIAVSVIARKRKESHPQTSEFVSIRRNGWETLTSRNERIPRRVAEHPEKQQQHQPPPQINRRNEETAIGLAGDCAPGESEKAVNDEWQR